LTVRLPRGPGRVREEVEVFVRRAGSRPSPRTGGSPRGGRVAGALSVVAGVDLAVGPGDQQAPGQLGDGVLDEADAAVAHARVHPARVETAGHPRGHEGSIPDAAEAVHGADGGVPEFEAGLDLVAVTAGITQRVVRGGVVGRPAGVDDA